MSGARGPGSGGSLRGRTPPAPTCECWSCGLPASSACPLCPPHPAAGLCPLEATAWNTSAIRGLGHNGLVPQGCCPGPTAQAQQSQGEGTGRGRQAGTPQTGGHQGTYVAVRPCPGPQGVRSAGGLSGPGAKRGLCAALWAWLSHRRTEPCLPWRIRELRLGSGADARHHD